MRLARELSNLQMPELCSRQEVMYLESDVPGLFRVAGDGVA